MAFFFFIWDDYNSEHVAEHGISPEEFEEVVCNPLQVEISRRSGDPIAFGYTSAGRFLACVYEIADPDVDQVRPTTAWELEQ